MTFKLTRARLLISFCSSLALLAFVSCRPQKDIATTNPAKPESAVSTKPPFETKEPDRYRAKRTVTSVTADGRTLITTTSSARDGELRRFEMEVASKQMVLLETAQGRFVLLPDEKSYAALADQTVSSLIGNYDDSSSPAEGLLHAESGNSSYQQLGPETIAGRQANKYRVVVNNPNAPNVTPSETLIWIDEALGMPIRSETKSSDGSHMTMELSDISQNVDKGLFQIPEGYQKLTLIELMSRVSSVK